MTPHPVQIEAYRKMTPSQKHAQLEEMIRMAREIKRAAIRRQHPGMNDGAIAKRVAASMLHGHEST